MRTYLIAYDLAEPRSARNALATAIMALGNAWARPLASTWYVRTSEQRSTLERSLLPLIDADDGLIIQEVATEAVLVNTALRWFHRRRPAPDSCFATTNIIAFPAPNDGRPEPACAA